MRKDFFKIMFGLSKIQPWVGDKYDELQELLYDECQTDDERKLILELIERFVHVSHRKFSELTDELVESIVTDKLDSSTTQIVAMTGDFNPDSAQLVSYALKPILERYKWRDHLAVTHFQRSYREFVKNGCAHKNIVLVDEFVGSGKSVVGRVKQLEKIYCGNDITDVDIFVKVIVSSKVGIEYAKSQGVNIESLICLDKGISDSYESGLVKSKLDLMDRLESILSISYNDRDLPKLGYGETECLYIRDGGNSPNSVFPIFWWPFLVSDKERKTMLTRAMGDA